MNSISKVQNNTTAFRTGLRDGDRILSINGIDTSSMNASQVRDVIRRFDSMEATDVLLTIEIETTPL